MSDEKLPSASLGSGIEDISEKDAGFGDAAEDESKIGEDESKIGEDDVHAQVADGVGDVPDEGPWKEEEEKVEGEAKEELLEESPEIVEKELEDFISHEEEESEEKKTSSPRSSSHSALIITAILEEILEAVFRKTEGMETGIEAEDESEEGGSEEEGTKEWREEKLEREPSVQMASLTTIKSAETIASELSDERKMIRQAEEEQLKKERQEQLRQEKFDENVRFFNLLVKERAEFKRKNAYLTRKMYEFYQHHKMEHLFKELSSGNQEMEARYLRALSRYEELRNSADIEEGKVAALIDLLTIRHEEVAAVMHEELAALAAREREVGDGLVFTLTSKILQDKALDKLIHQQLAKCAQLDDLRAKFFVLRDTVNAEESQLKALEDIGEGCTMKEYEQLRLHNQGCTEKLEEKDSELDKLRTKALSAMQIFTEVREAANAIAEDIESEKRALRDVERDLAETRERLGSEKKRRDLNRFDTVRLQREAGLISKPKLLRDYKKSETELIKLQENIARIHENFAGQQHALAAMRETINSEIK